MARYRFLIADIFSATPFGGNQLAMLPDARGISEEGMQKIAREFNFPETSFVLPATDGTSVRKVRIFTPARELPFAGHPTVGTACLLVREGLAQEGAFALEEKIGPIRVDVSQQVGVPFATLTVDQAPALQSDAVGKAEAAACLGLAEDDIVQVFSVSLGLHFTFIQLSEAATVDRADFDHAAWRTAFANRQDGQLYVFAGDLTDGGAIYSRLFAPAFGITEDPATGSAVTFLAGAGATLSSHQGDRFALTIDQGIKMGRPSRLEAFATLKDGQVTAVGVGGATAFVAEGKIDVPEAYLVR